MRLIIPSVPVFAFFLFFVSFLLSPVIVCSATAPDIPLAGRIYDYLYILEARGIIKSGILSTKPFSRIEGRRLTDEAIMTWESLPDDKRYAMPDVAFLLKKMDSEFRELKGEERQNIYIKPVESVYLAYSYHDEGPDHLNTNNDGDSLTEGHNIRAGVASDLRLWGRASFYLNPEFRGSDGHGEGEVVQGYVLFNAGNMELVLGREPIWWGPGYHGSLLMTDNAKPFDMIRLTSQRPLLLPWVFRGLGGLKPTLLVTQLEEDRDFPHAKLLGMRLDFRSRPWLRFALSRVIMFGGEGRKGLSLSDWFNILIANDNTEHAWSGSEIDNNQIVSMDFSLMLNRLKRPLPFSGMEIYGEIGAEDSSGNGWPKERAYLAGIFVDEPVYLDSTNIRLEWATTAVNTKYNAWYTHGTYSSGYTYNGRIIGHHMGADAEDIFARLEHSPHEDLRIGIEADLERRGIHTDPTDKRTWTGVDVMYGLENGIDISAGYGIEDTDDLSHFVWMKLKKEF